MAAVALPLLFIAMSYLFACDRSVPVCMFGYGILVMRSLFHFSVIVLLISPLLFLIQDRSFLKWLRFAFVWLVVSYFVVEQTPQCSTMMKRVGSDQDVVSLFTDLIFIVASLSMVGWWSFGKKIKDKAIAIPGILSRHAIVAIFLAVASAVALFALLLSMFGFFWESDLFSADVFRISLPASAAILISAALLVFLPGRRMFFSWMKFAFVWALFSWWFIWINRSGGMFSPGPYGSAKLTSMVLVFMSLFLFIIKSWEFKNLDNKTPVQLWLKWFLLALAFCFSVAFSVFAYGLSQ